MEGSRRSPQSDDPFAGFSILSLLPRTIGTAPVDPLPSSQAHEVESIRCFLKSAAVESSSKDVLEQAKEINKSHQCGARVPERDEDMALAQGKDRQQGRRPALGRKRAQFSLKPVAPVNAIPHVDVSSQIEHIEDPDEYFLAFEQLENADRELKKLRGDISTNPVQNDPKGTRKRRPGLLGKTASYKHHFSATDAAPEACKSLQDLALDGGSSSVRVSNDTLCCNTADQPITSQPMNTIDLPFDSKKRGDNKEDVANALLDNLLCSFKELGEGEEEAMLRKSLHIKSIDVGKIHLPELHTVQPIGPKASNTSQMQNGLSMCQLPQTSTSQARSPFAAISALYKRISLKGQLKTPYPVSPFNMDSDPSARKAKRIVSPMVVSNGHNEISSPVSKFSIPHTGNQTIIDDNSETVEELTIGCHYSDKSITDQSQKIVDNGTNISDQLEEEGNDIHSNCPEAERLTSSCIDINMTKNVMSTGLEGSADHSSWRSDVNASLCNDTHLNDVMPNDSSPEVQHPTSACAEINMTDSCSGVEYRTSSRCEIKMTKKLTSTDHECTADHSSRKSDVNGGLCNDMYLDNVTSNDSFPEVEHSTSACHEINMIESLTSTDHECTAGRSSLRSDDDTRLSHAHNILQDEVTVIAEDEQLTDVNCSTGQLTSYPTSSVYPCPPTSLSPSTDGPAADTSTLSGENNEVHGPQGSQDEAGKQKSFSTRQNKEKLKSIRQSLAGADSQNEAGKLKLLRTRQSKEKLKSKRQSLAGAGLAWQSGVRRSTRIRSRPLEFWRGERFLYGRIHDSLATVIGVKYASPGKEERSKDQALKVKSFVSDEYEDLVSQAAAC